MMRATMRPWRPGSARSAANGIMTWPATEAHPTATDGDLEEPQRRCGRRQTRKAGGGRRRRRSATAGARRSPSGTTSSSPTA